MNKSRLSRKIILKLDYFYCNISVAITIKKTIFDWKFFIYFISANLPFLLGNKPMPMGLLPNFICFHRFLWRKKAKNYSNIWNRSTLFLIFSRRINIFSSGFFSQISSLNFTKFINYFESTMLNAESNGDIFWCNNVSFIFSK